SGVGWRGRGWGGDAGCSSGPAPLPPAADDSAHASSARGQPYSLSVCFPPARLPDPGQRLIIISGEEGAGKSTIVRALLPSTPYGARIDAEDIAQTNPCPMDDTFFDLLRRNVADLVENFWAA